MHQFASIAVSSHYYTFKLLRIFATSLCSVTNVEVKTEKRRKNSDEATRKETLLKAKK